MTHDTVMTLADAHLSFRARMGHLTLLLAALGMGAVVAALLLTEAALPARTVTAFLLMLLISLAWSAYAAWMLIARRTLLAGHRVVAGRIAVTAAALFTLGSGSLGAVAQSAAGWAAAALGLFLLGAAVVLLVRAQRQHRALVQRLRELEALDRTRSRSCEI